MTDQEREERIELYTRIRRKDAIIGGLGGGVIILFIVLWWSTSTLIQGSEEVREIAERTIQKLEECQDHAQARSEHNAHQPPHTAP